MVLPFRGNHPSSLSPESSVPNPQDAEGDFFDVHAARDAAYKSLPNYEVELTGLHSLGKDPEITADGSKIYQELATFVDYTRKLVRREVTIAVPNPDRGADQISPYPIISGDPWTTGPHGINRDKIKAYLELGYPVVWVHHAGRHTPPRRDKSISRSAHQDHVVLDHLDQHSDFNTKAVIGDGFSRSAITREKFIAIAEKYNREVPYSDTEALVFARDMSTQEKIITLLRQLPSEAKGIAQVADSVVRHAIRTNDPGHIVRTLATWDLHPWNVWNELMWIPSFINSKVGHYVHATPVDTQGVRTFFMLDHMSQIRVYQQLYHHRDGIRPQFEDGAHVLGAAHEYRQKKYDRLFNLMTWMQMNGMSLDGFKVDDILQPQMEVPPVKRSKRHLGLIV